MGGGGGRQRGLKIGTAGGTGMGALLCEMWDGWKKAVLNTQEAGGVREVECLVSVLSGGGCGF